MRALATATTRAPMFLAICSSRAHSDLVFRTKGQLAIDICADAFADGVRFDFLCGDEVYGNSTELREFCEEAGQGYVLRSGPPFTWCWPSAGRR